MAINKTINKRTNSHGAMRNCIEYVLRQDKTSELVLFAILQNGAFQHDFIDFFMTPFMWYVRFCKWLAYPTYDNGFNQKIAYTGAFTHCAVKF